jgi:hypothetical protein
MISKEEDVGRDGRLVTGIFCNSIILFNDL